MATGFTGKAWFMIFAVSAALATFAFADPAKAEAPWVLVDVKFNPGDRDPPPFASDTTASDGDIVWVSEPTSIPHSLFTLTWPTRELTRSARFKPGHVLSIKYTGTAQIIGNTERQGGVTLDGLLLLNGAWDQSQFGPHATVVCGMPMVCTEGEVVSESVMKIPFPAGGDAFSFSFGMLNCGACTTEYVFARFLDPDDRYCAGRPATIVAADLPPAATIFGTDGDDVIVGTDGGDFIFAGRGDDVVCGRGGDDLIRGQQGHDLLIGGSGKDVLFGGPKADRIQGGADADEIVGNNGHDRIFGGAGDDNLAGDYSAFGDGEKLSSGRGRDMIDGGPGDDTMLGGHGHDRMFGRRGSDHMYGRDEGDVRLDSVGGPGMLQDRGDRMEGGAGADTIYGGHGPDELNGGSDRDVVHGGPADDIVRGSFGADVLHGGEGTDTCDHELGIDTSVVDCEILPSAVRR